MLTLNAKLPRTAHNGKGKTRTAVDQVLRNHDASKGLRDLIPGRGLVLLDSSRHARRDSLLHQPEQDRRHRLIRGSDG